VVLMAVEPLERQNLSRTLAMESDDIIVIGKDFLQPSIQLVQPAHVATEKGDLAANGRRCGESGGTRVGGVHSSRCGR
jgi:hypothetical protein